MNYLDFLTGPQGNLEEMDTITPEFSRIERQRKMLEMLRKTGQDIGGPGEMVGGGGGGGRWQARPSIYTPGNNVGTAIAKAATGYAAGAGGQGLDVQENAAEQEMQRRRMEWANSYGKGPAQPAMQPPASGTPIPNQTVPGMEQGFLDYSINGPQQGVSPLGKSIAALSGGSGADQLKAADDLSAVGVSSVPASVPPVAPASAPMGETTPPDGPGMYPEAGAPEGMTEDDRMRWMLQGAAQDFPSAKLLLNQAGGQLMTAEDKRQAAAELLAQKSDAAFQLQAERLAAQTQAAIAKAETQSERDRLTAEYRQSMIELQKLRIEASRKTGGGGKGDGNGIPSNGDGAIDRARTLLTQLDEGGGVTSTERSPTANIRASVFSSKPGQILERTLGTKNQTARDELKSVRLNILNEIKQRTGMSAQQLNSNVELKTWLDSLGADGMSLQANNNILNNIENFVLNNGGRKATPAGVGSPVGTVKPGRTGTYRKIKPGPDSDRSTWGAN